MSEIKTMLIALSQNQEQQGEDMQIITKSLTKISQIIKSFKRQLGMKANTTDVLSLQQKLYEYQSQRENLTQVLNQLDHCYIPALRHTYSEEFGYEYPTYNLGY